MTNTKIMEIWNAGRIAKEENYLQAIADQTITCPYPESSEEGKVFFKGFYNSDIPLDKTVPGF